MKPFFSVVIPTLNEENYLPNLLKDLSKQKEKSFEVIIVDADSEDKTKDVVFREKRLKIQLVEVHKKNVSIQRNSGAATAIGEYVVFIDADSRVGPSFLAIAKSEIKRSRFLIYIPTALPDVKKSPYDLYITLSNLAVELSQTTMRPFSNSGTFIIERNFFHHIGRFDSKLKLSEDHDIIRRAKIAGVSGKFSHELKFEFSLRRYERDGILKILMKYTIAFFYSLTNHRIEKEIFSYEMGGLRYNAKKVHKRFDEFKQLYTRVMKTLEETF